jgi:nitrate/TMAO reductase-like tetraheme cytochrome c subunit
MSSEYKKSPFVFMHPRKWVVNHLIFHEIFGLNFFMSNLFLLLQNKGESQVSSQDLSDLLTNNMPFLVSNSEMSPSNSWYPYTRVIHFDKDTGVVLASITNKTIPLWVDQVQAAKGILNLIARLNTQNKKN